MSSQQSYLVTLNDEQKIIINPDGTWHRVCAVVPEQVVERDVAGERDMALEPVVALEVALALEQALEVESDVAVEPIVEVEPLPDWWSDGPQNENNVAPGWTRCETEWGGGYCWEHSQPGKKYSNWDDAVAAADLFGDDCGGITKTTNGYSLRRTRQCIKTTITKASKDSLACWSKDYMFEGATFTPSRNPAIPLIFTRNSSSPKTRHERAKECDIESQKEFEEWISNGCE